MKTIDAAALKALMGSPQPHALFDVRELGEAEAGHILGATFMPRRVLESKIAELVPARDTLIVVYDEGGARAALAAQTLVRLGYGNVAVLDGGTGAWRAAGLPLAEGSNVPGKLFGEQVCEASHTPSISATTLAAWREGGVASLVCDIRTPEEYALARIPEAVGTPGFDVGLCADLLRQRAVRIVVNCAGRTRSIIACETLRRLGLDEVYALENGTMGWVLADLKLEKGDPAGAVAPTGESRQWGHGRAEALARSAGVAMIAPDGMAALLAERDRGAANVYAFDTRQVPEYAAGHIPGTRPLPGALAVQRVDDFIPVRAGHVILVDDDETRALITGYWLRTMGLPQVHVLEGGIGAWTREGRPVETGRGRALPLGIAEAEQASRGLYAEELLQQIARAPQTVIIDVGNSKQFAERHVAGAVWIPRGWLEERIPKAVPDLSTPVVVASADVHQSAFAAQTLRALGYAHAAFLKEALSERLPLESAPASLAENADVILPPYAKGREGMRRYLEWETKLTHSK